MDTTERISIAVGKKRNSKRLSSILKATGPLQDLDPNQQDENTVAARKSRKSLSRRVSFAHRHEIKEFVKESPHWVPDSKDELENIFPNMDPEKSDQDTMMSKVQVIERQQERNDQELRQLFMEGEAESLVPKVAQCMSQNGVLSQQEDLSTTESWKRDQQDGQGFDTFELDGRALLSRIRASTSVDSGERTTIFSHGVDMETTEVLYSHTSIEHSREMTRAVTTETDRTTIFSNGLDMETTEVIHNQTSVTFSEGHQRQRSHLHKAEKTSKCLDKTTVFGDGDDMEHTEALTCQIYLEGQRAASSNPESSQGEETSAKVDQSGMLSVLRQKLASYQGLKESSGADGKRISNPNVSSTNHGENLLENSVAVDKDTATTPASVVNISRVRGLLANIASKKASNASGNKNTLTNVNRKDMQEAHHFLEVQTNRGNQTVCTDDDMEETHVSGHILSARSTLGNKTVAIDDDMEETCVTGGVLRSHSMLGNKTVAIDDDMEETCVTGSVLKTQSMLGNKTVVNNDDMEETCVTGGVLRSQSMLGNKTVVNNDDMEETCVTGVVLRSQSMLGNKTVAIDDDMEETCVTGGVLRSQSMLGNKTVAIDDDMEETCVTGSVLKTQSILGNKTVVNNDDMEETCVTGVVLRSQLMLGNKTVAIDDDMEETCVTGGLLKTQSMLGNKTVAIEDDMEETCVTGRLLKTQLMLGNKTVAINDDMEETCVTGGVLRTRSMLGNKTVANDENMEETCVTGGILKTQPMLGNPTAASVDNMDETCVTGILLKTQSVLDNKAVAMIENMEETCLARSGHVLSCLSVLENKTINKTDDMEETGVTGGVLGVQSILGNKTVTNDDDMEETCVSSVQAIPINKSIVVEDDNEKTSVTDHKIGMQPHGVSSTICSNKEKSHSIREIVNTNISNYSTLAVEEDTVLESTRLEEMNSTTKSLINGRIVEAEELHLNKNNISKVLHASLIASNDNNPNILTLSTGKALSGRKAGNVKFVRDQNQGPKSKIRLSLGPAPLHISSCEANNISSGSNEVEKEDEMENDDEAVDKTEALLSDTQLMDMKAVRNIVSETGNDFMTTDNVGTGTEAEEPETKRRRISVEPDQSHGNNILHRDTFCYDKERYQGLPKKDGGFMVGDLSCKASTDQEIGLTDIQPLDELMIDNNTLTSLSEASMGGEKSVKFLTNLGNAKDQSVIGSEQNSTFIKSESILEDIRNGPGSDQMTLRSFLTLLELHSIIWLSDAYPEQCRLSILPEQVDTEDLASVLTACTIKKAQVSQQHLLSEIISDTTKKRTETQKMERIFLDKNLRPKIFDDALNASQSQKEVLQQLVNDCKKTCSILGNEHWKTQKMKLVQGQLTSLQEHHKILKEQNQNILSSIEELGGLQSEVDKELAAIETDINQSEESLLPSEEDVQSLKTLDSDLDSAGKALGQELDEEEELSSHCTNLADQLESLKTSLNEDSENSQNENTMKNLSAKLDHLEIHSYAQTMCSGCQLECGLPGCLTVMFWEDRFQLEMSTTKEDQLVSCSFTPLKKGVSTKEKFIQDLIQARVDNLKLSDRYKGTTHLDQLVHEVSMVICAGRQLFRELKLVGFMYRMTLQDDKVKIQFLCKKSWQQVEVAFSVRIQNSHYTVDVADVNIIIGNISPKVIQQQIAAVNQSGFYSLERVCTAVTLDQPVDSPV